MLRRLGLEDCFESVICFETLNSSNEDGSECKPSPAGVFDFYEYIHSPDSDVVLPRTPVVCKPSQDAFEKVFSIADIDPRRTVRSPILLCSFLFPSLSNPNLTFVLCLLYPRISLISFLMICIFLQTKLCNLVLLFQLFFDDSLRNLQTGKSVGLHTVLVSSITLVIE